MKKYLLSVILIICLLFTGCVYDPIDNDMVINGDLTINGDESVSGNLSVGENITANHIYADNITTDYLESNQIYLGGEQLLIPAYGEIYITNSFIMTCADADTFYIVSSNTSSGELKGFANNGLGRITYTDITSNRICLINVTITLSGELPDIPNSIKCCIYKNGVQDIPSTVQDMLSLTDKIEALPMVSLVTLMNTGDYLEVYLSSSKAGAVLTIVTMQIIATTVD